MLTQPISKLIQLRSKSADGITAIYLNTSLRTLALSLVGIFIPVFIFQKTQTVFGEGISIGLYGIIFYYFIWRFVTTLLSIPASKIVAKYGFRWSVLIANLFLVILLGLFSVANRHFWILPIAAVVHGFQTPLYWLAYRSLFAEEGALSHLGEKVSLSAISSQLAAVAGPVLGGVIITIWGFPSLFIAALSIVVLSGIPFFFMQHHPRKQPATLQGVIKWLKKKENRNEEVSFIGRNIDGFISGLFWPIFMFLIAGSYEKQGLVATLGLVFSIVAVYIAGRSFDKEHSSLIYRFGVIATALMWIIKSFVQSLGQLLFVEVGVGLVSPFYWVTYDSLLYERAREGEKNVLTFMVARAWFVSLALFIVLTFALLVAAFPFRFIALWGLASFGVLFSMFMWERRKK